MAGRRDIPGYYYDEEKDRYFRAPPEHLAYMSSDKPPCQKAGNKTTCNDVISTSSRCSGLRVARGNAPGVVPKSMFGLVSRISLCRDLTLFQQTLPQTLVCSSMPVGSCPFQKCTGIKLNKGGDLAVICYVHGKTLTTQVYQLSFLPSQSETSLLQVNACFPCSANRTPDCVAISAYGPDAEVVVGFTGPAVVAHTYVKRKEVNEGQCSWFLKHSAHFFQDPLDRRLNGVVCCLPKFTGDILCASCRDIEHSDSVYVLGLPNRHTLRPLGIYSLKNEVIISLAFREEPLLLYAGTRSGIVTSWDLRTKSKASTIAIEKDSRVIPNVIKLHPIDNNYLIISCMGSKLFLWDCRTNRRVLSYAGHQNSHHPLQTVINESQSFLAAVQGDKSIRIWSPWTGKWLRSITVQEYGADNGGMDGMFPAIAHSSRLSGGGGAHGGLLVGTSKDIVTFA